MTNASPIRILVIDDDEDDFFIIKSLLHDAMKAKPEVEWVPDYDDAQDAIADARHDIYLVDYRLGVQDGLELLTHFDLPQRPEPFIILTGVGDDSIERQAMEMGVADYLVKGKFEAELLRRVIEYGLQRKRMEAQRIQHLIELNQSKDEFIAVTSHQLRTPATAVKQYLAIVLGDYVGTLNEEQTKLLQRAYSSNDRQLKIVDDILRIAQLDLQKIELHLELVDVIALLERCIQDVKLTAENRGQSIDLTAAKHPTDVTCDPVFTAMAIGNLLDNASKYSKHDTTIKVSVVQSDDKVAISVADQGVGISPADEEKLFKKFSRVANPLSDEVGGTGLGLYWAQAITRMHHGDLTVESEQGVGSTFTITLPLTKKKAAHSHAKR